MSDLMKCPSCGHEDEWWPCNYKADMSCEVNFNSQGDEVKSRHRAEEGAEGHAFECRSCSADLEMENGKLVDPWADEVES